MVFRSSSFKVQLTSIVAPGVVNYNFGYDTKNNLAYRANNLINQKELFTYDTQNRLTNWDIHDATTNALLKTNNISYDVMGNIATKSDLNIPDAVTLKYEETAHPHALSSISGNPDAIPDDNLTVTYTDFCKIKTLTEGTTKQYVITYGVDDQRRRTDYTSNGATQTRYYLGDYEEESDNNGSDNNGNVKKIHYLSGGAMLVQNNGVETLYYGYKDNQGSLIALTDQNGIVVEKYAYDPWGARRNPTDWQLKDTRSSFITNRGYTGHEHLDAFNIINMNGRVYDPVTAMFFSPDPFIQSPENWMNYNRYSYVMNNPTRSTDPTGYYMAELKEERFESPGFDEVNAGDSDLRGGGGGFGSDPFGYRANTYYYNNGIYFNWNGDDVSFKEVYNNYILPNSRQTFIRNPFYNGSDRDYVINSLKSESGQIFFAGLTFKDGQQWYSRDGYKKLEQILNNYNSGSNNATGQGGDSQRLSPMEVGLTVNGIADKTVTLTGTNIYGAQKLTGVAAKDMAKLTALKVIGRVTGVTCVVDNYMKWRQDPSGNWWNGVETLGQATAIIVGYATGVEEVELIYNATTLAIDLTIMGVNKYHQNHP